MTEKVNPLANLSKEQRGMVEEAYKAAYTPEQIGVKFGLDFDDVRYYCENFIVAPRSRFERVGDMIDNLEEACASIKVKIDNGSVNAMELQAYQRLMSEYRIAVAELDSLKQPEDVVDEIIDKVLNPFLIDLIKVCTQETSKLSEEMMKLDMPKLTARGISTEVFSRLTNSVKHTLESAKRNLNNYHGVKKDKRKNDTFTNKTIQ